LKNQSARPSRDARKMARGFQVERRRKSTRFSLSADDEQTDERQSIAMIDGSSIAVRSSHH